MGRAGKVWAVLLVGTGLLGGDRAAGAEAGGPLGPEGAVGGVPVPSSVSDAEIVEIVRVANEGEVREGALAEDRATTEEARGFGARMVAEHGAANERLAAVAAAAGIPAGADTPTSAALTARAQRDVAVLGSVAGPAFDASYLFRQVAMHSVVLGLLDRVLVPQARDPGLRAYLATIRAAVAEHLGTARGLLEVVPAACAGVPEPAAPGGAPAEDAGLAAGHAASPAQLAEILALLNEAEIVESQAALARAESLRVRAFAEAMIAAHGAALARVECVAALEGLVPGNETGASAHLRRTTAAHLALLEARSGRELDRWYVHLQVLDHQAALSVLEIAAAVAEDAALDAEIARLRGEVEEHLAEARAVEAELAASP